MIVATPIDLPNIEPDNWDVFWKLWEENAKPLVKNSMNTDTSYAKVNDGSVWIGMDVFRREWGLTHWQANYVDISETLPNFYRSLEGLSFDKMYRVRLISNVIPVPAHTDDNFDRWSMRYLFYNENVKPIWYFTPPGKENKNNRTYFTIHPETNWFAYNDKYCWHGSDHDQVHKKILMQIYYYGDGSDLVRRGIEKYKGNTMSYE